MKNEKVKELYDRFLMLENEISAEIVKHKDDKEVLLEFKSLAGQMIIGAESLADIASTPSIHPVEPSK